MARRKRRGLRGQELHCVVGPGPNKAVYGCSASPALARRVIEASRRIDVRGVLDTVRVPTLVLHHAEDIVPLCHCFVEKYRAKYNSCVKRLPARIDFQKRIHARERRWHAKRPPTRPNRRVNCISCRARCHGPKIACQRFPIMESVAGD